MKNNMPKELLEQKIQADNTVAPLLRKMCELYAELLRVEFDPEAAWDLVYQMWVDQN